MGAVGFVGSFRSFRAIQGGFLLWVMLILMLVSYLDGIWIVSMASAPKSTQFFALNLPIFATHTIIPVSQTATRSRVH